MKSLKVVQKETRQVLSDRIKTATNREELLELERKTDKHYLVGTLSSKGLGQLDTMIMVRLAKMD